MILRKTIENGKEVFIPISLEEAVLLDESMLVFTDDSYDEYEERMDELEEKEDDTNFTFDSNDGFKGPFSKEDIDNIVNNALGMASNVISSVGGMFKDRSKNPKSKKITSMLPFMDDEDIHEIVMGIIEDKEEYKDLDLVSIMPFLSSLDCDLLFKVAIEEKWDVSNIAGIAPFVSSKAMSLFVDEYINGKYNDVDIESLYPFIDSKDVKRMFKYILKKEN